MDTYVEGVRFSSRGTTSEEAKANLAKRVQRSLLKNYSPEITKEGNFYVAQYGRDTGRLGQLKGYGLTQSEAVRNLNRLYDEALHNSAGFTQRVATERAGIANNLADISRLKEATMADTLDTYEGSGNSMLGALVNTLRAKQMSVRESLQSLTEAYQSNYAKATTRAEKAKLTREYNANRKRLEQELTEFKQQVLDTLNDIEQSLMLREANLRNTDTEAFVDIGQTSAEEAQKSISDMLSYENARIRDEVAETRNITDRNIGFTESAESLSKYADSLENRLTNSDGFVALPLKEQNRISAGYASATSDAKIMGSGEMKQIFDAFDACERGL